MLTNKRKRIVVAVNDYESYETVLDKLKELDVKVLSETYNVTWNMYDIVTVMNIEQAKTMLKIVKEIGGLMMKGEL